MTSKGRIRPLTGLVATAVLTAGLGLAACSGAAPEQTGVPATPRPSEGPASPSPASIAAATEGPTESVAGTVVEFTADGAVVTVVIGEDNPTTRSFLAMLPMTLTFSDFDGKEKVASPPQPFDYTGAEGMQPERGDLFSYRPWGNLGFFYNVDGSTYSDSLTRIGTTDDLDQIELLDGQDVTIAVAG